ncbi:MAG: PAM68 family protein [Sodalinema sp.]|uniref:photosystem II biosynthesis protein n=1 Tax=Sodalinema sp. TaxID=3080550 RepID=UPI00396F64E9
MASDSSRDRLPFEPAKKRKKDKAPKSAPAADSGADRSESAKPSSAKASPKASSKAKNAPKPSASPSGQPQKAPIPESVSRRMITRMALFSGTPTSLGVLSLVGSYFIIQKEWFPLPSIAVLLVSSGLFGLGVLGLSYGLLSASWDEADPGSKLGWREFQTNFGRMRQAWKKE